MGFLIFVFHADGTRSRPPGPARPWQPSPPRNRGHGGARDWTRPRPQGWPGDREPIPAPHPLFRLPLLTMGRRNLPGMLDPFWRLRPSYQPAALPGRAEAFARFPAARTWIRAGFGPEDAPVSGERSGASSDSSLPGRSFSPWPPPPWSPLLSSWGVISQPRRTA